MSKPQITIVCCVSDINVFNDCVVKSLKNLRDFLDFDLLPIYNSNNIYTASIAGNIGLDISKNRYVIYVHQDIEFMPESGRQISNLINSMDETRIVTGAVGMTLRHTDISDWGFCTENNKVGIVYDENEKIVWNGIESIETVHSLDEILLIIDKNSGLRFDVALDGFHLYGLDICLQARSAGYEVAASRIDLKHYGKYSSSIYRDHSFIKRLIRIHKKWRLNFSELYAPYAHWSDNRIVSYIPYALKNQFDDIIDVSRIAVKVNN